MTFNRHFHHSAKDGFPKEIISDVEAILSGIVLPWRPKQGPVIRKTIIDQMQKRGWSDRIKVRKELKLTITGIINDIGLCVQFGNHARVYADLIKLQVAYNDSVIRKAIIILPTREGGRLIGSNIASYERLKEELESFRSTITLPVAIYGVKND